MQLEDLILYVTSKRSFRVVFFLAMGINLIDLAIQNQTPVFYYYTPVHFCKSNRTVTPSRHHYKNGNYTNENSTCSAYPNNRGSCDGYEYITQEGEWTVVTEWDLVCEWKFLPPLITSLYFCGTIVGVVSLAHSSDNIGRKPVILFCIYAQALISLLICFVPNLWLYIVLRTLLGAVVDPLVCVSLVLLMEYCPIHLRAITGAGFNFFWSIGSLLFGGVAYWFRSWRTTQLAVTLPFILPCIYLWFIPESLRWLLSKTKLKEAFDTTKKVAEWNNLKLEKDMEETLSEIAEDLKLIQHCKTTYSYMDLFRTPELRKRFLITAYMCFTLSISYYGILLNMNTLNGDRYINFIIGAAMELIGYAIVVILLQIFGRKTMFFSIVLIGCGCCAVGVITNRLINVYDLSYLYPVSTSFILISKAVVSSGFGAIVLFMNELFPTVVRTMCLGGCGFAMRSGSLLAPQMASLGDYTDPSVPFVVVGLLLMINEFLVLKLPETKGAQMPDTIEDVEKRDEEQLPLYYN